MKNRPKKSYLITGGAGFIGSHLADALLAAGHRVVALDDLSTGRRANLAHLEAEERFTLVEGSVTDELAVEALVRDADVVVHLAAAVGVKRIVERPVLTIETNVMGTELVLRAAHRHGARVLLASTSEVYGKGSRVPFAEEDDVLLGASSKSRWGYAASKLVDEFLGLAYHREHGTEVVIFRLFNTVGPRQTGRYGMVVPRFVRQALRGEPITVYGDGSQSRCFCHVADVVRAIIALAEHPETPGRVFNVGSTDEISIDALAERIKETTGSESPIVRVPYEQAYAPGFEDLQRRKPDPGRIQALIGWRPEHDLDDILAAVIRHERRTASQARA